MDRPAPDIIPTPTAQRWREFRIQAVPVLVFGACVIFAVNLWRTHVATTTILGETEGRSAHVSSPQPGILADLKVSRFQMVTQDEPIAVIRPSDPQLQIALLQTQVDLFRLQLDPQPAAPANAVDYERLRLDWLQQKVDLATARVALERAENDFLRSKELYDQKVLSDELFDIAAKTRDQMRVEVEERSRLIGDMEGSIRRFETYREPDPESKAATEALDAEVRRLEARLQVIQAQFQPIILTAPIAGMVSGVFRQAGEHIIGGEPIVAVAAKQPDRIVGYVRQPLAFEPQVGMTVLVRTRSMPPLTAQTVVRQVGLQFEPVTNALAQTRPGMLVDLGLPLDVTIPKELALRPREHVDLIILPR